MATKLTTGRDGDDLPQPLTVLAEAASQSLLNGLTERLRGRGYHEITKSHMVVYGNLDCGATHAALIAQRMGVSRQAISKTLRELQTLGFVQLESDPERKNQKMVTMTERGGQLALDARQEIAHIERSLADKIGADAVAALRFALENGWATD